MAWPKDDKPYDPYKIGGVEELRQRKMNKLVSDSLDAIASTTGSKQMNDAFINAGKKAKAPLAVVKGMNYLFGKPNTAQAAIEPMTPKKTAGKSIPAENYIEDSETGNAVAMNPDGTMRWSNKAGETIARPNTGIKDRGLSTGRFDNIDPANMTPQQAQYMSRIQGNNFGSGEPRYFGASKLFAPPEDKRYKWNTKDAKLASIDAASRERIAGMYGPAEMAQARALDEDTQMSPLRKEMLQKQFDYYNSIATEPEEEGVDPKSAIEELKKKLRKQI